jgi:alkylation response protein AidB-like acyl-CoA dehydrogenase
MDFRFKDEDLKFKDELLTFLDQELPTRPVLRSDRDAGNEDDWERSKALTQKLADRRWLVLSWPEMYGGCGATSVRQAIFDEVVTYYGFPIVDRLGPGWIGPGILNCGTESQKQRLLPGIARAEQIWCQGFSEPNAGSDLASVQMRAVRDGDDFVLSGTKVWTTNAHHADWMMLIARTDPSAPKHHGVSCFLVPMDAEGITVRPILNALDVHHFNEVVFEDVRVPADCLLGDENAGWRVAITTLSFERMRIGIEQSAIGQRLLDEVTHAVRSNGKSQLRRSDAMALADAAVTLQTARLLSYRVASIRDADPEAMPLVEASMAKVLAADCTYRLACLAVNVFGLAGQLQPHSSVDIAGGQLPRLFVGATTYGIGGGSGDVLRNLIAVRGLGLPR